MTGEYINIGMITQAFLVFGDVSDLVSKVEEGVSPGLRDQ